MTGLAAVCGVFLEAVNQGAKARKKPFVEGYFRSDSPQRIGRVETAVTRINAGFDGNRN